MADSTLEHAFFYNSEDGDRVYDASSFEYWLKKFFTTGVFDGECQVTAAGSMTVEVAEGYANVDGKVKIFDEATELELETADSSYDRIDTVVIERNDTDRDVTLKIVTGTASASPQAADPERSGGVYQLVLAQIYVSAGATAISQSKITDTRADSDLCGIVAGTVDEINYSQITAQFDAFLEEYTALISEEYESYEEALTDALAAYKSEFDTWFAEMQDQLSEDAAGNLELQITALQAAQEEFEEHLENNSGTVGGDTHPVYLNEGVVKELAGSAGGTSQPVYLNEGEIEALSGTVGSGTKPIYMNSGVLTASSSTVGGAKQTVYLKSGVITKGFMVQYGAVTISPKANTPTSKSVTFGTAFSSKPSIMVTAITKYPGSTVLGVSAAEVSTTGFTVYITRITAVDTEVEWFAIGT